jgi:pSer/pThr/pTyr-binding forkhead associated (FHA) protein
VPRDETLADQTGEATVVITERVQVTMRLQRLQPAGRSEVIRLDRASYVLGRAHTCDIALFSPSASREHARLTNHEGEWYIEPLQNKSVLVNGSTVSEPTLVTHKMHIQLGADELLFLDDRAAAQASAAPTRHRRRTPLIATIAAVVAVLAAVAIWWFMHK